MKVKYSKRFRKQFQKLKPNQQNKFWEQLELLLEDPFAPSLSHHVLKGRKAGLHSINVGEDLRALYIEKGNELIIFELIGTHSQLYG